MRPRRLLVGGLLIVALLFGGARAHASTVGFFGADATDPIAAAGLTGVALTDLTAADLVGIEVLWIFNPSNTGVSSTITDNLDAITAFVLSGGVLSFHDRNVNNTISASTYLPGGDGISFTRLLGDSIDIATGGTLVTDGPGGIITSATLDGGTFSTHGYATLGSLPLGAVPIFNTGNALQIVDFYYIYGLGRVYYSSIPLDFYLGGPNPFSSIYAVNEVAFQAFLATPEPATLTLIGLGLAGFVRLRRRRK